MTNWQKCCPTWRHILRDRRLACIHLYHIRFSGEVAVMLASELATLLWSTQSSHTIASLVVDTNINWLKYLKIENSNVYGVRATIKWTTSNVREQLLACVIVRAPYVGSNCWRELQGHANNNFLQPSDLGQGFTVIALYLPFNTQLQCFFDLLHVFFSCLFSPGYYLSLADDIQSSNGGHFCPSTFALWFTTSPFLSSYTSLKLLSLLSHLENVVHTLPP